jgi:hypothetical protein
VESMPGVFKSLKIRAQDSLKQCEIIA